MRWGNSGRAVNGVAITMAHHGDKIEDEGEEESSCHDNVLRDSEGKEMESLLWIMAKNCPDGGQKLSHGDNKYN